MWVSQTMPAFKPVSQSPHVTFLFLRKNVSLKELQRSDWLTEFASSEKLHSNNLYEFDSEADQQCKQETSFHQTDTNEKKQQSVASLTSTDSVRWKNNLLIDCVIDGSVCVVCV